MIRSMQMRSRYFRAFLIGLLTCLPRAATAQPRVVAERLFEQVQLDRPVFLTTVSGEPDMFVIVEQPGRVIGIKRSADGIESAPAVLLDLTEPIPNYAGPGRDQMGMLGLAFHPDFANNRQLYISYSGSRPHRNVLSRFTAGDDLVTDPNSEQVLLEQRQPFATNNAGMIAFGPDGYLYMAIGDGGANGDPRNHAQDLSTLLGKMLRLDVDHVDEARGAPYAIPEDNPFTDLPWADARPEVYAYGLSNPWRFSFDRETGDLWLGDVGEADWEEINVIEKAGNYGWRLREGRHDFEGARRDDRPDNLIEPIHEYPHAEGQAIVGGYVYRGPAIPELRGYYVYADHVSGKVWALKYEDGKVKENHLLLAVPHPSSFGEDPTGELYICSFGKSAQDPDDDAIYRLLAEPEE